MTPSIGHERSTATASRRDSSHPSRSSQKRRQCVQMQNWTASFVPEGTVLTATSGPPRCEHGVLT